MKKNVYQKNLLIPFLKIFFDVTAVEAAIIFSYYLRFNTPLQQIFPVTKGYPPFESYLFTSIFLTFVYVFILSILRSYRSRVFSSYSQDIPVVLKGCLLGIVFAMSGAFLYRGFSYSRLAFFLMFVNTNVFLLAGRYFFHRIKRYFLKGGIGIQKTILTGSTEVTMSFLKRLESDLNDNFQIAGYCSPEKISNIKYPYLGKIDSLPDILLKDEPDVLFLTFDAKDHEKVVQIIQMVEGKNVELMFIPDLLDIITARTGVLEIGGMPVYRLKAVVFSGWQGFIKRAFDFFFSFFSLILLLPLFFVISILIKLTSKGPIYYKQERIGLDGKEFTILKFRSMIMEAEKNTGPIWAKEIDPRVTLTGKFLRRGSLDELPQLINVLKGDMSIVGPRPERKKFVDEFQKYIPKYTERHRVRSGMTGWAQVNGLRGQSSIEDRTQFDVYYIENWSLWFDVKIILMTFIAIFKGENAY
jgi:exopolysaccharide biosynthesis polyprenyl glycosylphosphotransferase